MSGNDQSPDLYTTCSISEFYELPIPYPCATIAPPIDDGIIGIVTYGRLPNGNNIREIMTAWIDKGMREGQDVYCSISVFPTPRCSIPADRPSYRCYSSGIGMAMVYENGQKEMLVEATDIIDNIEEWTLLRGCYNPIGEEAKIEIQNFKDNSQTDIDCHTVDELQNVSYTFVDNVVVAPFDILPDTLVVCDIEKLQFEGIIFYDLPLSWSDGVQEGERPFQVSGKYTLLADAEDCMLEESLEVIVVDETTVALDKTVSKCENETLTLTIDIPGNIVWNDNQVGPSLTVSRAGSFSAIVETECNTLEYVYHVNELDCDEVIYASNIFSPNGDGVNETIQFHLNPMLSIEGTIRIFDRWGTLVFFASTTEELQWNGRSESGTPMSQGVYIWAFVSQDQSITQNGDITLIR